MTTHTFTPDTPTYTTLSWVFARWTTETLLQWRPSEIEARALQVRQVNASNYALYEEAKARRESLRAAFRALHPRRDWPSALKRVTPYPPDLMGQWDKLMSRREGRIRQIATEKEYKRAEFLAAMGQGRYKAMQQRETTIRATINTLAHEHGIRLMERAVDRRLDELLIALGLLESADETTESEAQG